MRSGAHYSFLFRHLLPEGIDSFLAARKGAGKSRHVAEFFGSAVFVFNPELVDSATGLRLETYYEDGLPKNFRDDLPAPLPHPLWQEVGGSVYLRSTWNKLVANRRERKIPAYDLIVVKPEGGLNPGGDGLEKARSLIAIITNRIYETLSADDGLLLVDLMVPIPGKEEWTERLRAAGVDIKWVDGEKFSFRIIKRKDSPLSLPRF